MPNDDFDPEEDLSELRRYVVVVLLGLLVFVMVGNFVDDVWLGNKFQVDPAFYYLVGGVTAGLFAAEVLKNIRRHR
jgi:hypothetical protein